MQRCRTACAPAPTSSSSTMTTSLTLWQHHHGAEGCMEPHTSLGQPEPPGEWFIDCFCCKRVSCSVLWLRARVTC
eukprot:2098365-Prymnesium_polylepis.1